MIAREIQARDEKARQLKVIETGKGTYYVESSEGKICYKVVFREQDKSCTCGDFASKIQKDPQFLCKHILAVARCLVNQEHSDRSRPRLDERFIIDIKGKEFVLYSGLLDLAHQKGLQRIEVEAVQYPTAENGFEAICKATVESKEKLYIELGDANPKNTNKMVVHHILRVAATRAKARALRDFTNIGMTCLEELGDLDEIPAHEKQETITGKNPSTPKETTPAASNRKETKPSPKKGAPSEQSAKTVDKPQEPAKTPPPQGEEAKPEGPKPSSAQWKAIENLAKRRNISSEELDEMIQQEFGTSIQNITSGEASNFIRTLQQSA